MSAAKEIVLKNKTYLVCVNSAEYSQTALQFACDLARQSQAAILLLHVVEPADYQTLGSVADKMRQEKHAESQTLLQELASKAHAWSQIMPMVMMREGFIEDEIIKVIAADPSITMLITGTSPQHSKKSKIIPQLVGALGGKLRVPMVVVPGEMG